MKKLYYLIVLALILGLVLTGCVLFNSVTPSINLEKGNPITGNEVCIDLADQTLSLDPGNSIEGVGILFPNLTISSSGDVVVLEQGVAVTDTWTYGTGSGYNGCISTPNSDYGFGDLDRNHDYTFTFTSGVTVNSFSLRMLDFGDYFPSSDTPHSIQMTAYDAYNNIIDFHLLEIDGGKDLVKGDACTANPLLNEPGNFVFEVNGPGIVRVEIQPVSSIDPNIGFNDICFTLEPKTCETDLIAGNPKNERTDAGDVIVEYIPGNDYLTVTYNTEDGWLMEEIHFHASFDSPESWGKPVVNKAGNPAPGQFLKVFEDLGGEETYSFDISLSEIGDDDCGPLYFAAHAVVQKSVNECLVSGAGSDNVLLLTEDSGNLGYPVGYTAAYQTYLGTTTLSVLAYEHSSWFDVPGAQWIGSAYETEDTGNNTWRLFTRSFNLPDNAVNISGSLTMNCDNAEEVYLNDEFVGDGSPAIVYGVPSPPPGDAHGWNSLENWDISSQLMAGSNELWTMTRNYGWGGGPTGNPTGLAYKLCYEYDLVETAWGDGTRFVDKGNWAMHFTCSNLLPECVE